MVRYEINKESEQHHVKIPQITRKTIEKGNVIGLKNTLCQKRNLVANHHSIN